MDAHYYNLSTDALIGELNKGKETLLQELANRGEITEDQCDRFIRKYVVVLVRKGTLGQVIDKILFKNFKTDNPIYKIIQICSDEEIDQEKIEEIIK